MRAICRLFLLPTALAAFVAVSPAQQASERPAALREIEQARKLAEKDETEQAVATLRQAITVPQTDLSPGLRADILLNQAALLEKQKRPTEAAAVYCEALAVEGLDVPTRNLTYNNLGNVLLRTEVPPACDAVQDSREAFSKIEFDKETPRQRAIYRSNQAYAEETKGNHRQAVESYEKALDADPSFEIAARAKLDLLATDERTDVLDSARTIRMLANRGQFDLAGSLAAREIARKSWTFDDTEKLLASFVYSEARRGATFGYHPQRLDSLLGEMQRNRPELEPALYEIRKTYFAPQDEDFPLVERRQDLKRMFPYWSAAVGRKDFSALLTALATYHRLNGDLALALGHYSAAWHMDRSNARAALYAWTIITAEQEEYDPKGYLWRELNSYLRSEFYRSAGQPNQDLGDLGLTLLIHAEQIHRRGETEKVNELLGHAERLFKSADSVPEGTRERVAALCGFESVYRACRGLVKAVNNTKNAVRSKR